MKTFNKVFAVVLAVVFMFSLAGPNTARAATSPSLGTAESFAVLGGTAVTNVPTSVITGNVGLVPAAGSNYAGLTAAQVTGTIYAVDATGPAGSIVAPVTLTQAQTDFTDAYDDLAVDPCGDGIAGGDGSDGVVDGIDWTGGGDIDLAGKTLVPGVYCADSFSLAAAPTLTLSGGTGEVYIFRSTTTIITSSGSSVTGGDPCNVWWRAESSATLGTTTDFIGNILAYASITMETNATLTGRALAETAAVTLDQNTITNAVCASGAALHATLHVVKDVENDDGDDQHADDFTLYVKLSGTDVSGSPALGVASPGRTYSLEPGTYVVSEDEDSAYNQSFSGDCNSSGSITLAAGNDRTCTITNDDKRDSEENDHKKKTVPKLPAAGMSPDRNLSASKQESVFWNIILFSGILLVSASLVAVKRKRTI